MADSGELVAPPPTMVVSSIVVSVTPLPIEMPATPLPLAVTVRRTFRSVVWLALIAMLPVTSRSCTSVLGAVTVIEVDAVSVALEGTPTVPYAGSGKPHAPGAGKQSLVRCATSPRLAGASAAASEPAATDTSSPAAPSPDPVTTEPSGDASSD